MTIMGGIKTFGHFCRDIQENEISDLASNLEEITEVKPFFAEVIKTADIIARRVTAHYPKTLLITYIANLVFTFLLPGIATFILFAAHTLLFLRYQNSMFTSISTYKELEASEWFSELKAKNDCEAVVNMEIGKQKPFENITLFVKQYF